MAFDGKNASKEEFDAEIERFLQLGIRAEKVGKPERMVEMAIRGAERTERERNEKYGGAK